MRALDSPYDTVYFVCITDIAPPNIMTSFSVTTTRITNTTAKVVASSYDITDTATAAVEPSFCDTSDN